MCFNDIDTESRAILAKLSTARVTGTSDILRGADEMGDAE